MTTLPIPPPGPGEVDWAGVRAGVSGGMLRVLEVHGRHGGNELLAGAAHLRDVGLDYLTLGRSAGTLSGGEAQRIRLATQIGSRLVGVLYILDEPTTGLDPIGTRQIKDLIIKLAARGKTILLCSHLLADVEDVCDRIAILYGGKVLETYQQEIGLTRPVIPDAGN